MSDVDTLKAEIKSLSAKATQAKMDLHDLAEELPIDWQRIPEVAQRCYELHGRLAEARGRLRALTG
ncbi:MAG: CCE_0567 family metalloprotein [Magnetospirillum sp.]|nr:CCE_0567 family metalloprotein [Magnetospirillum sp.]